MRNIYKIIVTCIVMSILTVMPYHSVVYATEQNGVTNNTTNDNTDSDNETVSIKKLAKPAFTSVAATVKGTVELKWRKVKDANRYEIYRKTKNQKSYKLIARTKKTTYIDKKGKQNVTYYYQVRAIQLDTKKNIVGASNKSKKQKCKVRKKNPKVAYVGDSIMTGFSAYNILQGRKKSRVFAAVGMNTGKFYYSKEMRALLQYNPDRMYIMMGVNGMWTTDTKHLNSIIKSYEKIINACRKKNSHMEIVVMGVAPVGRNASVSASAVRKYNTMLKKKVSKKSGVYYCSITNSLADSNGYLQSQYSAGDGVHWKKNTYYYVLNKLDNYSKKIYWKK